MACPECEARAAELKAAYARLGALAERSEADRLMQWMGAFGCSMKQARLLLAFVDQPRRVMTRDRILDLTVEYAAGDDRLDRAADTRIKHLRKSIATKLPGREVIRTMYGLGYGLTEGSAEALIAIGDGKTKSETAQ